jgi:hypothetical protein
VGGPRTPRGRRLGCVVPAPARARHLRRRGALTFCARAPGRKRGCAAPPHARCQLAAARARAAPRVASSLPPRSSAHVAVRVQRGHEPWRPRSWSRLRCSARLRGS